MLEQAMRQDSWKLQEFFIAIGFYDLLPLALEMAKNLGYDQTEMIEAVCGV